MKLNDFWMNKVFFTSIGIWRSYLMVYEIILSFLMRGKRKFLPSLILKSDLLQIDGAIKIGKIVALSDATPNLDELLKKFEQVHVHTEDEVRAITAGNGIFTIKGDSGYFDVELSPGDVISVPVNTPHFFTLMKNRQVVAVRLFIDASGWVAHPYEDPHFKME
jgi:cupin superfamily acireductone dioxygenase involved in methionine salvage